MTFANLATGDALFVDANTFTYHLEPHARWGAACTHLLQQAGRQTGTGRFDSVSFS